MKVAMQFKAEMATANVKMPVQRLVHRAMTLIVVNASILISVSIMLIINKMTIIANNPIPNPFRSGGLNSMCAEMQMQR